jgi:hypothetical protein
VRLRRKSFLKIKNRKTKNRNRRNEKIKEAKIPESLEKRKRLQELRNGEARIVLHARPLPTASDRHKQRTARKNLPHLNSAPNEATTSIRLKAMMVCRDLRGNIEPGKWNPGRRGRLGARGAEPRGQVGVDSGRRAIC